VRQIAAVARQFLLCKPRKAAYANGMINRSTSSLRRRQG